MTVAEQVRSSSTPVFDTRFIGRQQELASLRMLVGTSARLVTLVGVGGSGKTRLAAELAELVEGDDARFSDGLVWADLSAVRTGDQVVLSVAEAFGLSDIAAHDPGRALARTLADRRLLLILDNAEDVSDSCRDLVDDLLANCPGLAVLATSRVPLRSRSEHLVPVPPMDVAADAGQRSQAAELFYDRAARVLPGYARLAVDIADVNAVCRRVDGLPLAIELAAPWIRTLSARDLLAEIDRSADVLSSDNPGVRDQHRSMRAVLDSTWRAMGEDCRVVMRRLSVFVGGFSGEAAERVADTSAATLKALADLSLIHELVDPAEGARYGMHALVHTFSAEMLARQGSDEVNGVHDRHLDYFLSLVERAHFDADPAHERRWMLDVRSQMADATAALRWAHEHGRAEQALRLTAALCEFWGASSAAGRYRDEFEAALALPWDPASATQSTARAGVVNAAGWAAMSLRDWVPAQRCFAEGAAIYRELGNEVFYALGLCDVGAAIVRGPDPGSGPGHVRQAVAICQRLADPFGLASATLNLGETLFAVGQDAEAEPLVLEGLRRLTEVDDAYGIYCAQVTLGHAYRRQARWAESIEAYVVALDMQQRFLYGTHGTDVLAGLGVVALALDRPDCAARLFGAGRTWAELHGDMSVLNPSLDLDGPKVAAEGRKRDAEWAAHYAAGRRLTTEQALTMAMAEAHELLRQARAPLPLGLSEREVDVVRLVAEGLTDSAIAERLWLSPRTVQGHLRSVYRKLEVNNRSAAANRARELGLLKLVARAGS